MCRIRFFTALVVTQYVCFCAGRRVTCLRSPHPQLHRENTCRWGQRFPLLAAPFTEAPATRSAGMTSEYLIVFGYYSSSWFIGSCHHLQYACSMILLMSDMTALIILQFLFYWYKCVLHEEIYSTLWRTVRCFSSPQAGIIFVWIHICFVNMQY
jgi:hypothetical protein